MKHFYDKIEKFLIQTCREPSPVLLALSGGPDSLSLFYALLYLRERQGIIFHIAHVDHGWREESAKEAQALQKLAENYQIHFHLKKLNPQLLKGNLESASRDARYDFFDQLCKEHAFQGVLTGHHQDDHAETVLKRLMEGAHWSKWGAFQADAIVKGVRILRPLLKCSKKEIQTFLDGLKVHAFDDSTNRDLKFLRARMRETIFPHLNQEFGKDVRKSFSAIADEAQELTDYFRLQCAPYLQHVVRGPESICLDLQNFSPLNLLEIKYLIRYLADEMGFFLSREIIAQAAEAVMLNKVNRQFAMGAHRLWVDRQRLLFSKNELKI